MVPPRRIGPLKAEWSNVVTPLVDNMGLQVRFNTQTKQIELKVGPATKDIGALQKGEDFCRAYILGFELKDAIALLRMDDLYIDGFNVDDVKTLHGEHLSRAIGRMVGKDGQTKFAIENTTRTRIVIAEKRVHILGTFTDIHVARDALVALILGSPPNKVYAKLKVVAARMKDR
jgi:RNA-binding protein PNO1